MEQDTTKAHWTVGNHDNVAIFLASSKNLFMTSKACWEAGGQASFARQVVIQSVKSASLTFMFVCNQDVKNSATEWDFWITSVLTSSTVWEVSVLSRAELIQLKQQLQYVPESVQTIS